MSSNTTSDKPLYLYLCISTKPGHATDSRIGCTSDIKQRLSISGTGIKRRKSSTASTDDGTSWKPILIIVIPAQSGISARALAVHWQTNTRKIHRHFLFGIKMARALNLVYFFDDEQLRTNPALVNNLPTQYVAELLSSLNDSSNNTEQSFQYITGQHAYESAVFNGVNFLRTASPPRSRKRRKSASDAVAGLGDNDDGMQSETAVLTTIFRNALEPPPVS